MPGWSAAIRTMRVGERAAFLFASRADGDGAGSHSRRNEWYPLEPRAPTSVHHPHTTSLTRTLTRTRTYAPSPGTRWSCTA